MKTTLTQSSAHPDFYFNESHETNSIPFIVTKIKKNEFSLREKKEGEELAANEQIIYLANYSKKSIDKLPDYLNDLLPSLYDSFQDKLNSNRAKEEARINRFIRRVMLAKASFKLSSTLIEEEALAESKKENELEIMKNKFEEQKLEIANTIEKVYTQYNLDPKVGAEFQAICQTIATHVKKADQENIRWRNTILNQIAQLQSLCGANHLDTQIIFTVFHEFQKLNKLIQALNEFEISAINLLPNHPVDTQSEDYRELVEFLKENSGILNPNILGGRASLASSENQIKYYTKAVSVIKDTIQVGQAGIVFDQELATNKCAAEYAKESAKAKEYDQLENFTLVKKLILNYRVEKHLLQEQEFKLALQSVMQLPPFKNLDDNKKPGIYITYCHKNEITRHIETEINKHNARIQENVSLPDYKDKPYAFHMALNNGTEKTGGSHWISVKVIVNPLRKTISISFADSLHDWKFFKPSSIKLLTKCLEKKFKGYSIEAREKKEKVVQNDLWACGYVSLYNIIKDIAPDSPIAQWDGRDIKELRNLLHKTILEETRFYGNHEDIQAIKDDERLMRGFKDIYQFTPELIAQFLSNQRRMIDIDDRKNYRIDLSQFFAQPFDLNNIKIVEVPAQFGDRQPEIRATAKQILKLQRLSPDEINKKLGVKTYTLGDTLLSVPQKRREDQNFEVIVENKDCIEVAQTLVGEYGRVALLNMANDEHVLGGVFSGARAQEEGLARDSDLMLTLLFHAHQTGGYFDPLQGKPTYGIGAFRQTDLFVSDNIFYNQNQAFSLNVITSAALQKNGGPHKNQYHDKEADVYSDKVGYAIQAAKIYNQIHAAIAEENHAMVLSAFGCGAFKNSPAEIAQLYRDILSLPEFIGKIKVHFAIKPDQNDPQNTNFNAFLAAFNNLPLKENEVAAAKVKNSITAIAKFEKATKNLTRLIDNFALVLQQVNLQQDFKQYEYGFHALTNLRNSIREKYVEDMDKILNLNEGSQEKDDAVELFTPFDKRLIAIDKELNPNVMTTEMFVFYQNLVNLHVKAPQKPPKNFSLQSINVETFNQRVTLAKDQLENRKAPIAVMESQIAPALGAEEIISAPSLKSREDDPRLDRLISLLVLFAYDKGAKHIEDLVRENGEELIESTRIHLGKKIYDNLKSAFYEWLVSQCDENTILSYFAFSALKPVHLTDDQSIMFQALCTQFIPALSQIDVNRDKNLGYTKEELSALIKHNIVPTEHQMRQAQTMAEQEPKIEAQPASEIEAQPAPGITEQKEEITVSKHRFFDGSIVEEISMPIVGQPAFKLGANQLAQVCLLSLDDFSLLDDRRKKAVVDQIIHAGFDRVVLRISNAFDEDYESFHNFLSSQGIISDCIVKGGSKEAIKSVLYAHYHKLGTEIEVYNLTFPKDFSSVYISFDSEEQREINICDPIPKPNFQEIPYRDLDPLCKQRLESIWGDKRFISSREWERSLQSEYDVLKYKTKQSRSWLTGKSKKVKRSVLPMTLNKDANALKVLLDQIEEEPNYKKPVSTSLSNAMQIWANRLLEYANDRGHYFLNFRGDDTNRSQKVAFAGGLAHALLHAKSGEDLNSIVHSINTELQTLAKDPGSKLVTRLKEISQEITHYRDNHQHALLLSSQLFSKPGDFKKILQNISADPALAKVLNGDPALQNLLNGLFKDGEELAEEAKDLHTIKRLCGVALALCHSQNETYKRVGERLKETFLSPELIEQFYSSTVCRIQYFITRLAEVETHNNIQRDDLVRNLSHLVSGSQSLSEDDMNYYFHDMVKDTKGSLKQTFVSALFSKSPLKSFLEDYAKVVDKVPFDYVPLSHFSKPPVPEVPEPPPISQNFSGGKGLD